MNFSNQVIVSEQIIAHWYSVMPQVKIKKIVKVYFADSYWCNEVNLGNENKTGRKDFK